MDRDADAYLFSPKEATAERAEKASTHRRADQKNNLRATDRRIGDRYSDGAYGRAVERACDDARVPRWTPNQLRHNAATFIRKEYGLEAAQVMLGHSKADVTQVYAERDRAKALKIAKEIG